MPKFKMDAIEVASSIHKGDFSKLRGKFFEMCDNTNMRNKYTLNQIGDMVVSIKDDLKQVNTRIDNLEKRIDGIDARLDGIDARLDYNNLKKLPESK